MTSPVSGGPDETERAGCFEGPLAEPTERVPAGDLPVPAERANLSVPDMHGRPPADQNAAVRAALAKLQADFGTPPVPVPTHPKENTVSDEATCEVCQGVGSAGPGLDCYGCGGTGGRPVADPVPAPTVDLDAIRARADAATPGPWEAHPEEVTETSYTPASVWVLGEADYWSGEANEYRVAQGAPADAKFIAHARTDVSALVAELSVLRAREAQVRELHEFVNVHTTNTGTHVDECLHCCAPWPCPTVAVLDGTTESGKTG